MRVLIVNSICGILSTGKICAGIAQKFESEGHEVKIAYGRMDNVPEQFRKYAVRIGNNFDVRMHGLRTRLLDEHGYGSKRATRKFLEWAEAYNPDMLWLHSIHGYYINIEMLFDWIKKRPWMQVKWTLHDCWAFTGHCSHFTYTKCYKWKTHCEKCEHKYEYPASILMDKSCSNFDRKRAAFTGVKNLQIITPSQWLADLVKQSFLSEYPVEVQHNVIDLNDFKPTPSNFRQRFRLEGKKIILGVASAWNVKKGLYDFVELAGMLDDRFKIVLVGLTKKQMKKMPASILCIERTDSPRELAEIYTAADVFVNPTYEDNYPTVNLEAQACGTKVITYNTGGCPETITKRDAVIIDTGDILRLKKAVIGE